MKVDRVRVTKAMAAVLLLCLLAPAGAAVAQGNGGRTLDQVAGELARRVSAAIGEDSVAAMRPLEVAEEDLQPAAAVFEDSLLALLATQDTRPKVKWVSRRFTEAALQEIAGSRRAGYEQERLPEVGRFVAATYMLVGKLAVGKRGPGGSVLVTLTASLVDVETTEAKGAVTATVRLTGPIADEFLRAVGAEIHDLTRLDEIEPEVLVGMLGEKIAKADRAYDLRREQEALQLYLAAEEIAERAGDKDMHAHVCYRLGNLYQWERENPEAALVCYEKAIELKPGYVLALNNAGRLKMEAEDYAEARELLSAAVDAAPDFAIARYNRGLAVLQSGAEAPADLRAALEDFQKAAEAGPKAYAFGNRVEGNRQVAEAWYYAGVLAAKLGDDALAAEMLAKAVGVEPENAPARYELLALAFRADPRDCEAVLREGEAYLKVAPEGDLREAALRAVEVCRAELARAEGLSEEEKADMDSLGGLLRAVEGNYGSLYAERVGRLVRLWRVRGDVERLPQGAERRFEIDVVALPKGADGPVSLGPDDSLRSGVDLYKVVFRPGFAAHVYVWQFDSTGKVNPIFPITHPAVPMVEVAHNPVGAGDIVPVPAGNLWFNLDRNVGQENVMFLVASGPRPDVEELLRYFNARAYGQSAEDTYIAGIEERPDGIAATDEGLRLESGATIQEELRKDTGISTRGIEGIVKSDKASSVTGPDDVLVHFHPTVFTTNETETAGYICFQHVE